MLEKHLLAEFEKKLEEEKVRIEKELSEIATKDPKTKGEWNVSYPFLNDDRSSASGSIEEMGDEIEEYNTRLSEEQVLEEHLHAINEAMQRIDQGTYGICSACGKDIPLERLNANPSATPDIEHAARPQ